MTKCIIQNRICKIKEFINFEDFPLANFPTNNKKYLPFLKVNKVKSKKKLVISKCNKCNYLCLKNKANSKTLEKIYSNFYKYPSAMLKDFIPSRDNFFLKYISTQLNFLKVNNILEIGCFDGYILHKLKKKYSHLDIAGCEPSIGADIANQFHLNVKKNFFTKSIFSKKKFDVIIMRHTLEHIYNLKKIFEDVKSVMNEKSFFIIEVPNINFFIKKGLLEVFSFQHIHYFSLETFKKLSKKYNLQIYNAKETPENLIIILKKKYFLKKIKHNNFKLNVSNFKKNIEKNIKQLNHIISNYNPNEICLWGAGGFAIAAINLYKIPIGPKTLIVDKDKAKINLSIGESNLKIKKVIRSNLSSKKLIIITSYYTNEIFKEIKKLKLNIDVLKIFPSIVIKKNV